MRHFLDHHAWDCLIAGLLLRAMLIIWFGKLVTRERTEKWLQACIWGGCGLRFLAWPVSVICCNICCAAQAALLMALLIMGASQAVAWELLLFWAVIFAVAYVPSK